MDTILQFGVPMLYLASAILFIRGLKGLTKVKTARRGNLTSSVAMLIAVVATLLEMGTVNYTWILAGLVIGGAIGLFAALRVQMTGMPELVALFNGFGGGASALVAASVLWLDVIQTGHEGPAAGPLGTASAITIFLSVLIGAATLSGSLVAFLKLSGRMGGNPIILPGRHLINVVLLAAAAGSGVYLALLSPSGSQTAMACGALTAVSLVAGVLLVIPIGGADMPVVISLLNSLSGVAASATGFVLENNVLIISGALVGASGLILTQIMCTSMNRTLPNVLFSGFGGDSGAEEDSEYTTVRSAGPEEAALLMESAESVVIVPGYGLAVAQAQHTTRELADLLIARGTSVTYGIHPVAGRMPGHMNVLLAEADVPYEQLIEMENINPEFKNTDIVLVVGANDVVNPAAENNPNSPIAGMPVLEVWDAMSVLVVKRSLSPGFAGIKNALFEADNTMMLFGDAKKILQELVTEVKDLD